MIANQVPQKALISFILILKRNTKETETNMQSLEVSGRAECIEQQDNHTAKAATRAGQPYSRVFDDMQSAPLDVSNYAGCYSKRNCSAYFAPNKLMKCALFGIQEHNLNPSRTYHDDFITKGL